MNKDEIALIGEIRAKLGISLVEARDFWMVNPKTAQERLAAAVEKMKASNQGYVSNEEKIRGVIWDYYKEPTTVNQIKSFKKIEEILGMSLESYRDFQKALVSR